MTFTNNLATLLRSIGLIQRSLTTADLGTNYGKPVNGLAPILLDDQNDAENVTLVESVNAKMRDVGDFRLEHARQTDRGQYLTICKARNVEPDLVSPPPAHYTGDFRDWQAAA